MTPTDIFENLVAEGLGIYADSAGAAVFNRKQLFFRYRIGSAGYTLVARRYECYVLPFICGNL
jgi:hypothetical protein